MRPLRATLAASVLALGALVAPVTGMTPLRLAPDCVGAGANHAAVVVEHGDGRVVTACVAFASGTISGLDLLRQSGIEYATSSYAGLGDAVCQLDGEPATYPAGCWSASSPYWVLFVDRRGAGWAVAPVGMSSLSFADGDAEGFRYQPQTGTAQPPSAPGRCPAVSPPTSSPSTPTATTRATPAPARTPQATQRPTATPRAGVSAVAGAVSPPTASGASSNEPPSDAAASPPDTPSASTAGGSAGSPAPPLATTAASDPVASAATSSSTASIATWSGAAAALVLLAAAAVIASRRRSRGAR